MQVRAEHPALRPRARREAALGEVHGRSRSRWSRVLDVLQTVKWHQDGTLTFRRSLRPRRLRLGRDADQRPQPAGLQDPRRPAGPQDLRGAAARPAGHQGPGRRHGRVLRQVPQRDALPGRRRRRCPRASGASPRRTGRATTTPPSASCARRAPRSCPCFWAKPEYVGPAAIVNAHRFIFDTRDDGRRRAPRDPLRRRRRLALPDDLQLHGRLPARHQHHAGHPRGVVGHRGARHLSAARDGSASTDPTTVRARRLERLVIRTDGASPRQPRSGLRGRRAHRRRRGPDAFDDPDAMAVAVIARAAGRPHQQRRGVRGHSCWRCARPARLGATGGRPAPRLEAHRGAAQRPLAGQGRQAPGPVRGGASSTSALRALDGGPRAAGAQPRRGRAGQPGPR